MIPKIIHYCWFGKNPLPKLAEKCIASWKKYCPDYQIIEWNEDNFNVNIITYTKEAYQIQKYAFVSDFARFYILYNYGGIYMDTDVEVLKPLDSFLKNTMFAGFEKDQDIAPGLIFASIKGTEIAKRILDSYQNRIFIKPDGTFNLETVVKYTTDVLLQFGFIPNGKLQTIGDLTLYPQRYFCPLDHQTGKLNITPDTYTIHHYAASWHSTSDKLKKHLKRIFGTKFLIILSKIKRKIKGVS